MDATEQDAGWGSEWTQVVDVVVVGAGAAGLSAAAKAALEGSSVLVLERALLPGGTTAKSGGVLWIPNNPLMRARGLEDARDDALRYMAKTAYPTLYQKDHATLGLPAQKYRLIETFYDQGQVAVEELSREGIVAFEEIFYPDYHADLPEDKAPEGRAIKPVTWEGYRRGIDKLEGQILIDQMVEGCTRLKVQIQCNSRVLEVLKDEEGEVVGLEVRVGHRAEYIGVRQGIVFASGGFLHNVEMAREFLRGPVMGGAAAETSTGDFVRIGAALGAPLGNMGHAWWAQLVVEQAIRNRSTLRDVYSPYGDSMMMVNRHGRRAMNEKATYNERGQVHYHWDASQREYPNYLMFWLFDDALIHSPQASRFRFPIPQPGEQLEYVISGNTWSELIDAMRERLQSMAAHTGGVELAPAFEQNLRQTLERFNAMARAGKDLDFQRGETPIEKAWAQQPREGAGTGAMHPFAETGPYHCIILGPAALDTKGGPQTDERAQVMSAAHTPIPRIYGAGNCVASPAGQAYWGAGGTIGVAFTYGYIAGREVASRERRGGASPAF